MSAEVDLRDFPFMPLDVVRLRDSGLTAKATGDEFRAAVLLWCASWHQHPAANLPDDDDELANLCGYGRAPKEWKKIREGALRGWVKCSDGRLYHPTVAEKAREAWQSKVAQRARTEAARKAREEARQRQSQAQSQSLSQTPKVSVTEDVPLKQGTGTGTGDRGQGQGQGQGRGQGLVYPFGEGADKPRRCRLPADWKPDLDDLAFAGTLGMVNGRAEAEAERFRDFWTAKSGKDATKLDWSATWRNWVRRAAEQAPTMPGSTGSVRPLNRQLAIEAENRRVGDEWLRQEAAKDAAQHAQEALRGTA